MKKGILLALVLLSCSTFAQNLQLNYDFGKDRKYITSTVEMFKPDEYGATYWFVDFDFNHPGNKSASLGYFEIARYIRLPLPINNISATVQYNDGTAPWGPLGHVWLAGLSYPIDLGIFVLNTDLLYRKDYFSEGSDVQLTCVWFIPILDGKINFTGFFDVWSMKNFAADSRDFVFLSEPQLWINFGNHLALGGEVEISNNFIPGKTEVQINPTLGLKWNF
ncbi:MAG: DUF5020 domain-containing protein [Ignavibacteria bacterium CG_4_8_14_3_um_filter_37_9]|nr:DUF5020 family protein [Ignavibacteria bacterium]OIO17779.1 MAG: hypothetical protein AUJ54_09380 [Ignavibacteria bacterium CG1_02_37_35]PIW98776.1 MAG: DUF5020 domain-containing protein [Ignavibacteria bacterium CG_4_8_14_3_um_filter_37_9]PIX93696.1 MAG: DUF5020 domain-containing protein [Ignavibacteria bacterium CG_4_10_14_3_um_filter_37_18]PJC59609.1 MAG: DUF5020 domain-containing protein [Ignavibacteria bacterium CG_4_9_14_0_2_um_filter_37_13]